MTADAGELAGFLVEAKRNTYASRMGKTAPSRKASKDLGFARGKFRYLDSYFGERDFSGQEVVYYDETPIWSMNYYGRMASDEVPPGFIETLREALLKVEESRPFRGCGMYARGEYTYHCGSDGTLLFFHGQERIEHARQEVYRLYFHGGQIR
jgi:hypothetical protein